MATRSALDTLIELANKEADEAAKRLGEVLRSHEEAKQKFDLLQQYRDDYAQRCQNSLANGISTTHFNNYRVFMQKLDHAISGQQTVVSHAGQRVEQARANWQVCEQKKMSFVTLSDRANKEEARRELWRDQKQNDEHAARSVSHKRNPS
ncbi:flagellar export protein FliJ [Thiobacillus sp.]|uniref:flagellar export protein FliJ n=1 Tax=Thiobacillus sp. TaxID=924 RepID=UPI0025FC010F|nr:flagellar export protein FliJ [Thiobacillus sp.]MBT9540498.1 flagellar export protein FliJ [Thiobacillus sp.]